MKAATIEHYTRLNTQFRREAKAAIGARVMYAGHDGWFVADVIAVAGAIVIRAAFRVDGGTLNRGRNNEATHHLADFPDKGFWHPDLGVFVVPEEQVTLL